MGAVAAVSNFAEGEQKGRTDDDGTTGNPGDQEVA
jgi:hypothetical protein